ncbi:Beclin-1-like protein B [Leucoagaricus sp. SymC.cos]|nr:Beclin-1-like protein B [Leucoagaricus sp. SymC.cos]
MSFGLVCQQCKEPLQPDASLIDLAPSAYDTVAASLPASPTQHARQLTNEQKLAQNPASPYVKAAWERSTSIRISTLNKGSPKLSLRAQGKQPQRSANIPSNESFVLLQDSVIRNLPSVPVIQTRPRKTSTTPQSAPNPPASPSQFEPDQTLPSPLSHHLRSATRLFNLLSTRTEIDHPLCAECTQILLKTLNRQLEETKKERDGYIAFEKEIKKEKDRGVQGLTQEEAEKKIERLKSEERLAIEQLKGAERERAELDEELRLLELDEKALEAEEAEFWRHHNDQLLVSEYQTAQLASLRAAHAADVATLEKLERTNVYNDAFCIGHDGVFGTINGLRLGRVPGVPVEWAEINAAWGQALLLLYTIARKLDYTFTNYRLVPMGSFSRIEKTTGDKAIYELYGSGDLHLGRLLHNRRFDFAMVAFLDCLKHLMDYVKSQDPNVEFPHQIVKDRIGDVSVKLQFNQEEAWTRSLRHVLLALKICLKWTTNGANG